MRGIIFDFGNVLYRVDYRAMALRLASDRPEELLGEFVGDELQIDYESGRIGLDEVLKGLTARGFGFRRSRFLEAYLSVFTPVEGMSALLLRLAGTPLGLLSNTSPEHASLFIEKVTEFSLFEARLYSFEMGTMKPDPALYREIAHRMGIDPRDLAYVDDVEAFAHAAQRLGMTGIPFSGAAGLEARLRELGFPV